MALFPLCDAGSVLMDALLDTNETPATRGDALVFAWRLQLPDGMNVGHAANAVLVTVLSAPRTNWSRQQLLIIRELMVLAGREEPLPTDESKRPIRQILSESIRARKRPEVSRDAVQVPGAVTAQSGRRKTVPRAAESAAPKTKTIKEANRMMKQQTRGNKPVAKEDKEWWKLVGKEDPRTPVPTRERRKTFIERVSREP